jgi:23S rRNA pseudouridine1911/1915/1917 synthase
LGRPSANFGFDISAHRLTLTRMLLLDHLVKKFPASTRTTLKRMVEGRRVRVNGRVATKLKEEVAEDAKVELLDKPSKTKGSSVTVGGVKRAARGPAGRGKRTRNLSFPIVFEDADILVIHKPAGLLTSTNEREKRPTAVAELRNYLAETDPKAKVGIIHRLDRDASGLLVFTKHNEAFASLKSQFYHHTVERLYTIVLEGLPTPQKGTIENLLYELPTGLVVQIQDRSKGQIAVTDFETIRTLRIPPSRRRQPPIELPLHDKPVDPWSHRSLVRVKLQTGRKHQIRAHFAARKTPIVGDRLYGPDPEPVSPLLLAATSLAFDHPRTGERMKFEIEVPEAIRKVFADAGEDVKGQSSTVKGA